MSGSAFGSSGSLNALLNATYQTGATAGASASAWLHGFRSDFVANTTAAGVLFVISGFNLWLIRRPAEAVCSSR